MEITMSHKTIIKWLKIVLFSAFAVNILRVCIRTWKYGGSKSTVTVQYDDGMPPEDMQVGM
jgi:hypothetical protein